MQRNLLSLSQQTFDLLVIGGGIFGAGVARDAALRGLRVALVEQNDFASGTSSRSSKLIHGGFRYLEHYDFRLVAESCRERRILREIAPHRVTPLPLLLPVYRHDQRPLWKLRLGMTLYDMLALYRNVKPHRTLSAAQALELEPALRPDDLLGAIRYYDCQEDDARFCIDNILHAGELGAVCANYCKASGFREEGGRLVAARVTAKSGEGSSTSEEFEIRARLFVNACGPWVEQVAGLAIGPRKVVPALSPTKGVHILLPSLTRSHGVLFQGKQDSRMMFVLPWNDCTLVGTTDTDFHGDPAHAVADEADVEYLLGEARALFPQTAVTASDVITTFAGVRPLLKSGSADPSARSRDHQILRRGENLLSLAGGKYTTYRFIAKQTVDQACGLLRRPVGKCLTAAIPIPDRRPKPAGEKLADSPEIYASDIQHAISEEMAMTVEDIMRRRTGLSISRFGGPEIAQKVRAIADNLRMGSPVHTRDA